jgi:2-haloacid dehalogenase
MPDVTRLTTAVFDLGGVLIDWDPRYLYRQLFDDPGEMESFLAEVTTTEWNAYQDAGRPWADAVELLVAKYPERRELIEAFHRRWPEMLAGEIQGTVEVLDELRTAGVRLVALSNWSAEMFPVTRERFSFLRGSTASSSRVTSG